MKRCRSGSICIDVLDVIDHIEDDDLLGEVQRRRLIVGAPGDATDLDIVREAYDCLQRGKIVEARVILDRLLFPKWTAPQECQKQFDELESQASI